jgi:hypothetical protein
MSFTWRCHNFSTGHLFQVLVLVVDKKLNLLVAEGFCFNLIGDCKWVGRIVAGLLDIFQSVVQQVPIVKH